MRIDALCWAPLLLACPSGSSPATADDLGLDAAAEGGPAPEATAPEAVADAAAPAYTVHAWGTFTSIAASDGVRQGGAQHDEEALGAAVNTRDVGVPGTGAAEILPELVTQKLQTPVLFFYAETAQQVTLTSGFGGGIFDAWFPGAQSFQPPVGALQALEGGTLAFSLELLPGADPTQPAAPESLWDALRQVDATPVRGGGQTERFVFYRGLGAIEEPMALVADPGGGITVHNTSGHPVAAAWILWVHENGGKIMQLGSLPPGGSTTFSPTPKEQPIVFERAARAMLGEALETAGLTPMEAEAALATCDHNFFKTYGVRVLYLAPEAWVDEAFPITLDPAPIDRVRVVMGRIELLEAATEAEVVAAVEAAYPTRDASLLPTLGFFAEAKLRRARALIPDAAVGAFCDELVALAAQGAEAWSAP